MRAKRCVRCSALSHDPVTVTYDVPRPTAQGNPAFAVDPNLPPQVQMQMQMQMQMMQMMQQQQQQQQQKVVVVRLADGNGSATAKASSGRDGKGEAWGFQVQLCLRWGLVGSLIHTPFLQCILFPFHDSIRQCTRGMIRIKRAKTRRIAPTSFPLIHLNLLALSTNDQKLGAVFCCGIGSTSNHSNTGNLPVRSLQRVLKLSKAPETSRTSRRCVRVAAVVRRDWERGGSGVTG